MIGEGLPPGRLVREPGTLEARYDWVFHGDVYVELAPDDALDAPREDSDDR